jgi:NADP-dependent 3-hydroxy acid dehydrogenase YdfG
MDVMSYASVEAAAKTIEKEFGRLDILINNAGFLGPFEEIVDSNIDKWWMNYEINLRGVLGFKGSAAVDVERGREDHCQCYQCGCSWGGDWCERVCWE